MVEPLVKHRRGLYVTLPIVTVVALAMAAALVLPARANLNFGSKMRQARSATALDEPTTPVH
jgi:hypothetical protein